MPLALTESTLTRFVVVLSSPKSAFGFNIGSIELRVNYVSLVDLS